MPRITPVDYATAQGREKEQLDTVKSLLGATPNLTTTMARSAVLGGWLGLSGALGKGSVRAADGERIALAVAEYNACSYCLSAHSYLGEHVAKLSDEEIVSARRFESENARSRALLAFARAVLEGRGEIGDEVFAAARADGLSDAELGDVVGHVAVNVLTNYFNKAFRVEVDFPPVEPFREAVAA